MDEGLIDELMHRVNVLEQEKRRWKAIGIGALLALAVLFVGGGLLSLGSMTMYWRHNAMQRDEAMMMMMRAEEARAEAERARLEAEKARLEADKAAARP